MSSIEVQEAPSGEQHINVVSPFSPEGQELARIAKGMIGKFDRVGSTATDRRFANVDLTNYIDSTSPKEEVADLRHRLEDHSEDER